MANKKRLIDANVAIERAKESDKIVKSSIWETGEVIEFLEDCPIVDAVEVVRCKDCKHWSMGYCNHFAYYSYEPMTNEDDFCSYGERKDCD